MPVVKRKWKAVENVCPTAITRFLLKTRLYNVIVDNTTDDVTTLNVEVGNTLFLLKASLWQANQQKPQRSAQQ